MRDFIENYKQESVAIVGIGCRFPGGINNSDEFWDLLCKGRDAITKIPSSRWSERLFYHPDKTIPGKLYTKKGGFLADIDKFDAEFFGISPREAEYMDPQQRLLLETTWEAIEDSGIDPRNLIGSKTGVFIGLFMHDYENIHSRPSERVIKGPHSATGMSTTIAANRISYIYDFKGPSMIIDTACSSSLIAIHLACQSLRNSESEFAIAGGVNIITNPEVMMSLCKATMLSPDGYSKAFDASANGYARAEGSGIIFLKTLSKALENKDNIYAIIRGSATNQDGRSDGQTVPSSNAQQIAIKEALKEAQIEAKEIQYFEAHGTGTPVGDPSEVNAIGSVVSIDRSDNNYCPVGSVKTNFGHTESAAGVAGIIKTALMLKNKKIPPNLHFNSPNPKIPFEKLKIRIPTSLEEWRSEDNRPLIAGVNSFGFGGSNACVILEESPVDIKINNNLDSNRRKLIIPLSGNTVEALRDVATSYINYVKNNKYVYLSDIGNTTSLRKGHHQHRLAIVAKSKNEFKEALKAYLDGENQISISSGKTKQLNTSEKLVFVFSGMGQQWWAMGRELFENEIIFKNAIEECNKLFQEHTKKWSLVDELTKSEKDSRIDETQIAQPCIFAIQVGLYKLWRSKNIKPDAIVGHSVGEVAAAYASGALDIKDAVTVCFHRSRLQKKTAGKGKMVAVGLSPKKIEKYLLSHDDKVSIAAVNSPNSVTIAGDAYALEEIYKQLEDEKIFARFLKVEVPYHSPVMDQILPELRDSLKIIAPKKANIPIISTVTGNKMDGTKMNEEYWCRNVREPVSFNSSIEYLIQTDHTIFVEIGAHPVLAMSIIECLESNDKKGETIPSLIRKKPEQTIFLSAIGKLYCIGYPVDWKVFYNESDTFVKLPCYPWQNERYWIESEHSKRVRIGIEEDESKIHPLVGEKIDGEVPTWSQDIDLWRLPYLKDHVVQGSIIYPAAAYLETGIDIAKKNLGDVPCALKNVEIKAPLLLKEDIPSTVRVLYEKNKRFSIYSKKIQKIEQNWTCHTTGEIDFFEDDKSINGIDISKIKSRCVKEEKKATVYKRFNSLGLEYGKEFQLIQSIWMNEKEILAEITCSQTTETQLNIYWFHPALLDVCFQALAAIPIDGTYLPVHVKQINFLKRPKNKTVFSYMKIVEQGLRWVKGDAVITDPKGNVLVEIQGLKCQYVEGTRHLKSQHIENDLYEYRWIHKPLLETKELIRDCCEYMLSPIEIYKKVKKRIKPLINHHKREKFYSTIEPKLDMLCKEYFITALKKLGYSFDVKNKLKIKDIAKGLGINEDHYRLFERIFKILEQENILRENNGLWENICNPENIAPKKLWSEIIMKHPDHIAELTLIERCGSNLSKILNGEKDPLSLIFPPDSLVIEHLYKSSPTFRIYNKLAQEAVDIIINNFPEGQNLKILEIGAGTGSLSSYILPILQKYKTEYVFTDISTAFTKSAEQRFINFGFVEYKILDIEKNPLDQNFEPHSFDLILASDAIHATTNLNNTIRNVKKLLASKGILILLEATKPIRWFDLVFGTLKGWWLFSDSMIRPEHVLLTKKQWIDLLRSNEFIETVGISDEIKPYVSLHNVFIAQAPIVVGDRKEIPLIERRKEENGPWLILSEENKLSLQLIDMLREIGIKSIIVTKGNNYKEVNENYFIIRGEHEEDIKRLVLKVYNESFEYSPTIINLWNISSSTEEEMSCDLIEEITTKSCMELLYISQSLSLRKWKRSPYIWIITNSTQLIGNIKNLNIEQTPLWGVGRVLMSEKINWKTRLIDLSLNPTQNEIKSLFNELIFNEDEDEISLREEKRYIRRFLNKKETNKLSLNSPNEPFAVYKQSSKSISDFVFESIQHKQPGYGEVKIKIEAFGLNFKDIARISGILNTEINNNGMIANFGLECSGVIVAFGEGVENFKIGDEVIGLVSNCFGNYTVSPAKLLIRKPLHLSFEEAATIPIVFLTAYYALHKLANIKKNEKILIHTASGGVGLASFQMAKAVGAEIFATAGNSEKRNFLKSLGIQYVGDSRKLNFYEEIKAITKGDGIDIIINTLPESGMLKSIKLLKPITGRVVDLSNIYSESIIKLKSLKEGLSFFTFDLEKMGQKNDALVNNLLKELIKKFDDKILYPIPYRVFPIADIKNAFHYMKSAKHIGKVVVTLKESCINVAFTNNKINLHLNGTYLITGGLGGFGLAVAKWFVSCGAKHLVLLGRSGDSKPTAKKKVQEFRNMGVNVYVEPTDITNEDQIKKVFSEIEKNMPPLRGVIHAAMVLEDVAITNMKFNQMKKVINPKILGAWNLHKHTRHKKLDFFICFSSFTSLLGNAEQGNYAAGNLFLDSLSHYRMLQGLPSLTICWGAIGEVGYVSEHEAIKQHFNRQGVTELSLNQALITIQYGIKNNLKQIGILKVNWEKLGNYSPIIGKSPKFSNLNKLSNNDKKIEATSELKSTKLNIPKSPEERKTYLIQETTKTISNILGVSPSKIDLEKPLEMYGLDSLMAVEVNVQIKNLINIDIPKMTLIQGGLSIITLSETIEKELLIKQNVDDIAEDDIDKLIDELSKE